MKKSRANTDLIRKIVGHILSSEFTEIQINSIALDLVRNPKFCADLGNSLRKSIQAISGITDQTPTPSKVSKSDISKASPYDLESAIKEIQDRKIPKKIVISAIPKNFLPRVSDMSLMKMSLRDVITRSFQGKSEYSIDFFLKNLNIQNDYDPYLAGIDKKR
ncbi:hypothetical protein [Janthinobacterium sp.]|uniref:hypothetical protein n=1 Tax=Janthinobacterium sp. TaxID=1871054 RepID=UPI0025C593ED|nr:hypothetical protein [Janthinobacterium sp.]